MADTVTITVELPTAEAEAVADQVSEYPYITDPTQYSSRHVRARARFYAAVVEQYKPTPEPAVGQVWERDGVPRLVVSVRNGVVASVYLTGGRTLAEFREAYTFLAHTEAEWEAQQ